MRLLKLDFFFFINGKVNKSPSLQSDMRFSRVETKSGDGKKNILLKIKQISRERGEHSLKQSQHGESF